MKQISGWTIMTSTTVSAWDAWESESCLPPRQRYSTDAASPAEGGRPKEHLSFLRRYQGIKDPNYNENLDLNRMPVVVNPNHFVHKDRVGKLKVLMISHNLNLEGAPKVLFDHAAYFASSGRSNVTMVSLEGRQA